MKIMNLSQVIITVTVKCDKFMILDKCNKKKYICIQLCMWFKPITINPINFIFIKIDK